MKKIPTLYLREDTGSRRVTYAINPTCLWVIEGRGYATRKLDGTCCLWRDGVLYRRHELKAGRTPPPGFEPADEMDPNTGKQPGWVPVSPTDPGDRWHREAIRLCGGMKQNTTYELVGPKINGNPEGYARHILIEHGQEILSDVPRNFDGIRDFLIANEMEGIVFYCGDLRAKIKSRDFGLAWPRKKAE